MTKRPIYEPSPEAIAAVAREIQREWSDRERQRREGHFVEPPVDGGKVHHLMTGG